MKIECMVSNNKYLGSCRTVQKGVQVRKDRKCRTGVQVERGGKEKIERGGKEKEGKVRKK
jgi:hypothetical protein